MAVALIAVAAFILIRLGLHASGLDRLFIGRIPVHTAGRSLTLLAVVVPFAIVLLASLLTSAMRGPDGVAYGASGSYTQASITSTSIDVWSVLLCCRHAPAERVDRWPIQISGISAAQHHGTNPSSWADLGRLRSLWSLLPNSSETDATIVLRPMVCMPVSGTPNISASSSGRWGLRSGALRPSTSWSGSSSHLYSCAWGYLKRESSVRDMLTRTRSINAA